VPCPGGVRKREFELRDGWSSVQLRSEPRASRQGGGGAGPRPPDHHAHGVRELVVVALLSCARVPSSPVPATVLDLDRRWIGRYRPSLLAVKSAPRLCGQSRLFRLACCLVNCHMFPVGTLQGGSCCCAACWWWWKPRKICQAFS